MLSKERHQTATGPFLTICVAWRMSGLKLKNTIPRSEITEMIRDIYELLLAVSKSSGVSPDIAEGIIDFEQRFKDESPAERVEAIAAELCSSGLLVPDPAGGSSNLRFPHKQFFEFLVAKAITIKGDNTVQNAALLLDKCSSGIGISARLNSEPNAVSYLTECVGANLGAISSRWQRFSLRLYLAQLIFIHRIFGPIFRRTMKSREELQDKEVRQFSSQTERIWAFERWARAGVLASGPLLLFWSLAFFGVGYLEIFSGRFVEIWDVLLTDKLPNDAAQVSETDRTPVSSVVRSLSLAIIGVMTAGMASVMARFMSDNGFAKMIFAFLHTHWHKSAGFPSSRLDELRLALSSLSRGRVQFISTHNDTTDYKRFLYPAVEFGGELD